MPEVYILLVGASVATPLLLFGILAWSGIERWRELAVRESEVRRFIRPLPGVALRFVLSERRPAAVLGRPDRTAA